jgi:hypothetical protein
MVVFINMTIIKQNSMTYQHKVIFYIWDGYEFGFGVGTYIPVIRLIPVFCNREKPIPISKPSQNGENPSNWGWFGRVTAGMSFLSMPTLWSKLVIGGLIHETHKSHNR